MNLVKNKCAKCRRIRASKEFGVSYDGVEMGICRDCHKKLIEKRKKPSEIEIDDPDSTKDMLKTHRNVSNFVLNVKYDKRHG